MLRLIRLPPLKGEGTNKRERQHRPKPRTPQERLTLRTVQEPLSLEGRGVGVRVASALRQGQHYRTEEAPHSDADEALLRMFIHPHPTLSPQGRGNKKSVNAVPNFKPLSLKGEGTKTVVVITPPRASNSMPNTTPPAPHR